MSCASWQCIALLSPKLYALRGSPKRAAWILLLWQADCVGGQIGLVGRYSG